MIKVELFDNLLTVDLTPYNTEKLKSIPEDYAAFNMPLSFKRKKEKKYIYPRFFNYRSYFQFLLENYSIFVKDIFKNFEEKIVISDNRTNINYKPLELDISDLKFLKPFQIKVVEKMSNTYPSVIKLKTGSGKTIIALSFIYGLYKPALFITDQKNLSDQFIDKFNQFIKPIDRSLFVNDLRNFSTKNLIKYLEKMDTLPSIFNIITVQKLLNVMKEVDIFYAANNLFNKFEVIIYDEAHTTSSSYKYGLTSMLFNTNIIYGLTATPYFSKKDYIKKLFFEGVFKDNIISIEEDEEETIKNATEKLNTVKIIYFNEEDSIKNKYLFLISKSKDPFLFYRNFYISKVIQNSDKLINILFKVIDKYYNEERKILITVKTIKDVEYIYSILSRKYQNISIYTGSIKKGDVVNSKIQVSTIDIVKKGYDDKDIEIIINLYPIRTKSGIIQLIGRSLRKSNKPKNPEYIEIIPKSIVLEFPGFKSKDLLLKYLKEEYNFFNYKIYEV